MKRRIPILSTLIVLAAVAGMIALGVWQLQRLAWKEALLERFRQAQAMSADVTWPKGAGDVDAALYRHTTLDCAEVLGTQSVAGHNAQGETGWAHVAHCRLDGGGTADIVLGWSADPAPVAWSGGPVGGVIAPGRDARPMIEKLVDDFGGSGGVAGDDVPPRLIAGPPLAGLAANAAPDPEDVPNNHLAYAVQWFLFAATALAIYALALRRRWRGQ